MPYDLDDDDKLDQELKDLTDDKAPKSAVRIDKKPTEKKPRTPSRTSIQKKVEGSVAGIELMVRLAGDEHCADVIEGGTERFAVSLQNLADQNPKVRKAIERMLEGGAWGEVIFSGLAMVLPIVMHHLPVAGGEKSGGIIARLAGRSETDGTRIGEDNGQPIETEFPYADTAPSVE